MANLINIQGFNLSVFKKKDKGVCLFIYNTNYYCVITILNEINIINTHSIKIISDNKRIHTKVNAFLRQFYLCNFTKIKFTGKGYKIKKNTKQSLIMLFNKSHTTTLW